MSTKTKKPLKSTVTKPGDYYVNFVNKINGIRHSETGIKAKKKALDLVEEKSNSDAKVHAGSEPGLRKTDEYTGFTRKQISQKLLK